MSDVGERMEEFKARLRAAQELRPDTPRGKCVELITILPEGGEHALVLRSGKDGRHGAVLAVVRGGRGAAQYIQNALEIVELFMPAKITKTKEEISKKPKPEGPLVKEAERVADKINKP